MPASKQQTTELSILIVSYNTAELTIQTIQSAVEACTQKIRPINAEIIIVDNNSKDDSVTQIKKIAQKSKQVAIKIIENKTNPGFATANNQAIQKAKGKYVLLLNSDTIVKNQSFIELIQAFEQNPIDNTTADLSSHSGELDKLGIQSAMLLNLDGSDQPQGGSFPNLFSLFSHMLMLDDIPIVGKLFPSTQHTGKRANNPQILAKTSHLVQKDWVGGTAMAIRKQVLDQIGLLDENIFMYGEDTELCMRAKNHHWDIVENIKAPIVHLGNASGSSKKAIIGELTGYLYIWSKHKPYWQYSFVKAMILFGCQLRMFVFGTILGNQTKKEMYQQAYEEVKSYE